MKRLIDATFAFLALTVLSPLLALICLLIFATDGHSPFYVANRVGIGGRTFRMVKFRSMFVGADKTGGASTSAADERITRIGHVVRRYKLDELVQLWNVLFGDMSLVGPRPNVPSGVAGYSKFEQQLLSVRPGITDFASIVFADEGEILREYDDADAAYDKVIRPWKSRLGVFYVVKRNVALDLKLILWTAISIVSRQTALDATSRELARLGASPDLVAIARRQGRLDPVRFRAEEASPPG